MHLLLFWTVLSGFLSSSSAFDRLLLQSEKGSTSAASFEYDRTSGSFCGRLVRPVRVGQPAAAGPGNMKVVRLRGPGPARQIPVQSEFATVRYCLADLPVATRLRRRAGLAANLNSYMTQ